MNVYDNNIKFHNGSFKTKTSTKSNNKYKNKSKNRTNNKII